MKKIILGFFAIALFLQAQVTFAAPDKKAVIGKWKVEVNTAPYEYANSVLTVGEKDGKLTGKVKFDSGLELEANTIEFANNQLIISLTVEYNDVKVTAKVAGSKITGVVDTPDGPMNLVANRMMEKKSGGK